MKQLGKAIKLLGPKHMLNLNRARKSGWVGIIRGLFLTRTTCALMNIGFFDEIQRKEKVNPRQFADEGDLDPGILDALCDYMRLMGVFRKEGESFLLDKKGHFFVSYLLGWFDLVHGYEEVFHNLEALLKKERTYGKDLYRRPEHVARGSGEASKLLYFPVMIGLIKDKGYKQVLDLGCGDGTFLIHLCQQATHVQGVGVDISGEAIESGRAKVERHGLEDRIRLLEGDVLKLDRLSPKLREVDAATVFFVFHEFLSESRERLIQVLKDFKDSFPKTDLLVCEAVWHDPEELPPMPGPIAEYQLFHQISKQKLVKRETWQEIFRDAGFAFVKEEYLAFARTVIYVLRGS